MGCEVLDAAFYKLGVFVFLGLDRDQGPVVLFPLVFELVKHLVIVVVDAFET